MSGAPLRIPFAASACDDVEHLPVAVLLWSVDRICIAANAMARRLFAPLDPIGLGGNAVFARWPVAPDLRSAPSETETDSAMLAHDDGRLFSTRIAARPDGALGMTLVDVTAAVKAGEHDARDALTGLLQRTGFRERLAAAIAVAERNGTRLAVLYVDLDRFKSVNDTLGHGVGDALLVKVADRKIFSQEVPHKCECNA